MRMRAWALALTALMLPACGSDDASDDPGGDGSAGFGAEGGDSGAGGTSRDGGSGGSGGRSGSGGIGGSGGFSGASGSGGSAGSAGRAGSSGSAGSGGVSCNDPGPEPNDTVPQATPTCNEPPCEIGACDGDGSTVTGVVGPGDVDLHAYFGNDTVTCVVNAAASTEDSGYRLCLFVLCAGGADTDVQSCPSGTEATGPGGMQGCCVQAPGAVEVDHDCPGLSESSGVYIQIDQASACTTYSVDYHF